MGAAATHHPYPDLARRCDTGDEGIRVTTGPPGRRTRVGVRSGMVAAERPLPWRLHQRVAG
jgi:hypothetical protein